MKVQKRKKLSKFTPKLFTPKVQSITTKRFYSAQPLIPVKFHDDSTGSFITDIHMKKVADVSEPIWIQNLRDKYRNGEITEKNPFHKMLIFYLKLPIPLREPNIRLLSNIVERMPAHIAFSAATEDLKVCLPNKRKRKIKKLNEVCTRTLRSRKVCLEVRTCNENMRCSRDDPKLFLEDKQTEKSKGCSAKEIGKKVKKLNNLKTGESKSLNRLFSDSDSISNDFISNGNVVKPVKSSFDQIQAVEMTCNTQGEVEEIQNLSCDKAKSESQYVHHTGFILSIFDAEKSLSSGNEDCDILHTGGVLKTAEQTAIPVSMIDGGICSKDTYASIHNGSCSSEVDDITNVSHQNNNISSPCSQRNGGNASLGKIHVENSGSPSIVVNEVLDIHESSSESSFCQTAG